MDLNQVANALGKAKAEGKKTYIIALAWAALICFQQVNTGDYSFVEFQETFRELVGPALIASGRGALDGVKGALVGAVKAQTDK